MTADTVGCTRIVADDTAANGESTRVVMDRLGELVLSKRLASPQEIKGLKHARLAGGVIAYDAIDGRRRLNVTFSNTPKMIDIK